MEIRPGIHRIELPFGNRKLFQHILVGDKIILIDTGVTETPLETLFPYIERIGRKPSEIAMVLVSHPDVDHFGGNSAVRERVPHAIFLAHVADSWLAEDPERVIEHRYNQFAAEHGIFYTDEVKQFLRQVGGECCHIDVHLRGGEVLRLADDWSVRILHTPGHSKGHVTVYDPRSNTAIVCDAVLWRGLLTQDGDMAMPPTYELADETRYSVDAIRQLNPDLMLTSHFDALEGEAIGRFLGETREYVDSVDRAILKVLATGETLSLLGLIDRVDPIVGPYPEASRKDLAFPLSGHLRVLTNRGLLSESERDGVTVWTAERGDYQKAQILR